MNCPICNTQMIEGNIVANGNAVSWFTKEECKKLNKFIHKTGKEIGKSNILLGRTTIDNAFWCESCNKIVGVFDIVE